MPVIARAATFPQGVTSRPNKVMMPTVIGILLISDTITMGQTKAFHAIMKIKIARVAKAGLQRGNTILKNTPQSPQPSNFAASESSGGMTSIYFRIRRTPKTCAQKGRIIAIRVLTRPRNFMVTKRGIIRDWKGNIKEISKKMNSTSLPGIFSFANAYPARLSKKSENSSTPTVMRMLFDSQVPNFPEINPLR